MKKKLKKKIKELEDRIYDLENPTTPRINTIGFQQTLRNSDDDNEFDGCGNLSWVDSKKDSKR